MFVFNYTVYSFSIFSLAFSLTPHSLSFSLPSFSHSPPTPSFPPPPSLPPSFLFSPPSIVWRSFILMTRTDPPTLLEDVQLMRHTHNLSRTLATPSLLGMTSLIIHVHMSCVTAFTLACGTYKTVLDRAGQSCLCDSE